MEIKSEIKGNAYGIKITVDEEGEEAGWVYLYVISNDLHDQPVGVIENLFVHERFRRAGVGSELIRALVNKAKEVGCYKVVGTSRHENIKVHEFYKKLGFQDRGLEFRMDLSDIPSEKVCPI